MYAGAAREAVFSVPAVVRRINADFVPLALRAPLVNGADAIKDEDEKWFYQRINRAKLAPQGICILAPDGQVLAWVQMFDSDKSVLDFLDHAQKRFRDAASAKPPVATERFVRYPTERAEEHRDETKLPRVADGHAKGKICPSVGGKDGGPAPGSMAARLVGRALDERGNPVTDVVRQEHYVEDQFSISPAVQAATVESLSAGGIEPYRLPDEFAKLCASHAHLGHIDVKPCLCMIRGKAENKGEWKRCEFSARKVASGAETTLWRIEGRSEVVSEVAINGKGVHDVALTWEGFIEVKGNKITHLILLARGKEKLQFAKDDHPLKRVKKDEVAFLPGGRPIDQECGVRYGIIGRLVAPAKATVPEDEEVEIPDEARRQLTEALGPPFLVFRERVQQELKLSDAQKPKFAKQIGATVRDAMLFFEKLDGLKQPEREKQMASYREKAGEKLAGFLRETLTAEQRARLRQLELQREGAFALGRPDVMAELKLTDDQRKQFVGLVREMQEKIVPLVKEAQEKGNPEEIRPKAMKIRGDYAGKIEAILTDAQKKKWSELRGKPFEMGD